MVRRGTPTPRGQREPRVLVRTLELLGRRPPSDKPSVIHFVARVFIAELAYRSGAGAGPAECIAVHRALPEAGLHWWEGLGLAERLEALADPDQPGSPIELVPFNFA